jgi:hypothetical protein
MMMMSAHDTVSGHASSSFALILSTSLKPRRLMLIGMASLSPFRLFDFSMIDPSHPCASRIHS